MGLESEKVFFCSLVNIFPLGDGVKECISSPDSSIPANPAQDLLLPSPGLDLLPHPPPLLLLSSLLLLYSTSLLITTVIHFLKSKC